jgi:CRP/FNR family transcriptional regulator, cyclic AMP receptor protein
MAGYDRALYQMYLAKIPMFSSCTSEQLDLIAQLADAESVTDGREVVREGDAGDGFYVVTSGHATVRREGHDIARIAPGDYFGELSLFDPAPRNATVTAAGMLTCVVLAPVAFTEALDRIPALRDALLRGMARRIHESDQRV